MTFCRDTPIKQPLVRSIALWLYNGFECCADVKKKKCFSHQVHSNGSTLLAWKVTTVGDFATYQASYLFKDVCVFVSPISPWF